jgi:DNA-binding transcriptional ArsR family regulator
MVEERYLDRIFAALSDPTRRAMLYELKDGGRTVGELAAPFEMSLAGASKHVKVLETAGLVRCERHGRTRVCSLNPDPLAEAERWLAAYAEFWNARFDDLEAALQEDDHHDRG